MSFLYSNLAPVAVASAAAVMVWLHGGTRGDLLPAVTPWLFALLAEVLFCFPQCHADESIFQARARVWRRLRRDPVAWLCAGLLALLAVPLVNSGLCPSCDAAAIASGVDPAPPVPLIPFSVSPRDHWNVLQWFMIALPSLLIVRHGMTSAGKRLTLELVMWNGLAVAALGFLQVATGAGGPFWTSLSAHPAKPGDFFATFGYPNMAGDYFVAMFALAAALWRHHCETLMREKQTRGLSRGKENRMRKFWHRHYFLIPAAVFFFAALNTLSRAAIVLATATATIFFAHTLTVFLSRMDRAKRVKAGGWSIIAFGVLVFFAVAFMPEQIGREVDTLETTQVLNRLTGKQERHASLATALWREHWLFGCGGWGYAHLGTAKLEPKERRKLATVGGANVHNDHLQFLAEHGVAGLGAMAAIAVLLLLPVYRGWRQLVAQCRFKKGGSLPPKPIRIFALPAPVAFLLVSVLATFIHAFADCPLRSPAILTLYFVQMAAMSGFMPKFESESNHH